MKRSAIQSFDFGSKREYTSVGRLRESRREYKSNMRKIDVERETETNIVKG